MIVLFLYAFLTLSKFLMIEPKTLPFLAKGINNKKGFEQRYLCKNACKIIQKTRVR